MIQNISFINFKRFKNESLDLTKPITLLYGQNSSGKSSVLKGLAALIETFSWVRNKHEPLVAQGQYANIGIYRDYVHNHIVTNKVSFVLTTDVSPWMRSFDGDEEDPVLSYISQFCYDRSPYTEQARIYSIDISLKFASGEVRNILKLKRAETKSYYTLTVSYETFKKYVPVYVHRKNVSDKEIRRVGALKTKLRYTEGFSFALYNQGVEDELAECKIRILDRGIYNLFELHNKYKYLGPLRSSPSRSYTLSAASADVGPTGENTPSVISYLKRSSENIRENRASLQRILRWVDLLFPGRSISVENYEELVKLRVTRTGFSDSIQDVGFGFSQILPIIVQAAALKPGDAMIIEQPELHLHPSAQVAFSRFLVEASRFGVRFIIETHSEHILRGLQLAISNNSIDPDKGIKRDSLKVFYFPSDPEQTSFEIELNDDGELVNGWPAGFFDESFNLTKEIVKNKISKMSGGQ